jgi:rhodanese-related sulfurtransferase
VASTLDELLDRARSRITRLAPREAYDAVADGALIVDTRDRRERERGGVVPGSIHIPRSVLEWRLAPESRWRNPHVDPRRRLVLLCAQGYSSSLAAATLVELGIDAGDVIGGFEAWREAGLPVVAEEPHDPPDLPGMGPPDTAEW